MRALLLTPLLILLTALNSALAAPPDELEREADIVAALSQTTVEIRSNFAGADLILFGAIAGFQDGDDVAVVVRGPASDLRVMRKERSFGIWINRAPVRFEDVSGYYAVASTRPLKEIGTFSSLRRNQIGRDHVRLNAPETQRRETRFGVRDVLVSDLGSEIVDYREALGRIKGRAGLYVETPGGVTILEGGLFQARLRLPPATPVGDYVADVYLFRAGQPIASRQIYLDVRKAGLERAIYDHAHNHPHLYGLICVLFAVFAGWAAAEIFRRR